MTIDSRRRSLAGATSLVAVLAVMAATPSAAQTATRDVIADWLSGTKPADQRMAQSTPPTAKAVPPATKAQPPAIPAPEVVERDPREGEQAYEQARKLMAAIDAVLQDTAKNRGEVRKLPSKDEFLVSPLWTETKEDREKKVRDLLDAALGIVTDVPVVDFQKRVEERRKSIREIDERIVKLREKQLGGTEGRHVAGRDHGYRGQPRQGHRRSQEEDRTQPRGHQGRQGRDRRRDGEVRRVQLAPEQIDMLLDSVLSGDLVRLVAVFNSAKIVDAQLGKLMAASGDNTNAARKYFAMHAALFAMLVHAQDSA